jgi:Na+/H+ antiporter NhaB
LRDHEHIQPAILAFLLASLAARLLVLEHMLTRAMFLRRQTLPVHLLVLELTLVHILAPEHIMAHMQTHLPVLEHTPVHMLVADHIMAHILVHMRVIQFKQLKIQYQQYLSGYAPLKLYYILYIISFYGELNDCE